VFDPITFELLRWAAAYYHHPIGEVFAAAMPAAVRHGRPLSFSVRQWSVTTAGEQQCLSPSDRRAPKQRAVLNWLASRSEASEEQVEAAGFSLQHLRAASERGWTRVREQSPPMQETQIAPSEVELTPAQMDAVASIAGSLGRFEAHLLFGVTGSGKTEVYLRAIEEVIRRGGQALVLVPEISLTPQLLQRFRRRFSAGVAVIHSGLTGADRHEAWAAARSGHARIVIGTRSAVFTPMRDLALIIVDEEHDASFKQQEGFRYSARDIAVLRAQRAALPVVLGSATPSLESLENVAAGRYRQLLLPQRTGAVHSTKMTLVDLRGHAVEQGLSQPAIQAIDVHLKAGGQIIVFLNRRGFAPTLFCSACGWVASCAHCDARMTVHRRAQRLRCHHCGAETGVPTVCGACQQPLMPVGQGTERVEETLARLFPAATLARLDRDSVSSRGAMEEVLQSVHSGAANILIGTQMLTKGHHFPDVSLVVILDADQGLFATDYRATERLAQMITQVAGRAGRAARAGEVLIQTRFPDHPLLHRLIDAGYEGFAADALLERRAASWPPYSRLALLRADAREAKVADEFLKAAAVQGAALLGHDVKLLGPATALIARRADRHRAHLLLEAAGRPALQHFLQRWLPRVEAIPARKGLRWSIDVDPTEVD
jgi:primosomal protein N' (replication factor Y)